MYEVDFVHYPVVTHPLTDLRADPGMVYQSASGAWYRSPYGAFRENRNSGLTAEAARAMVFDIAVDTWNSGAARHKEHVARLQPDHKYPYTDEFTPPYYREKMHYLARLSRVSYASGSR